MRTSSRILPWLWAQLGGEPTLLRSVTVTEAGPVLPAVVDVDGFAADSVAAAALALAELWATRTGAPLPNAQVATRAACAVFAAESVTEPIGWELPPTWDPLAGDYETSDGWIKLHTNYAHHRDAVLSVLGVAADRQAVTDAVRGWPGEELETAVVAAGGCAAAMRSAEAWRRHPAGIASASEVPCVVRRSERESGGEALSQLRSLCGSLPFEGVRVVDLTRVMAGPVATRVLAAYGADVLRIDPPGFEEVPALLPEMTAGKRCASLNLKNPVDRERFLRLIDRAHVLVLGYRPGALASVGCDLASLQRRNPSMVTVTHNAYGWSGPWQDRRGFDSLVQMSSGIAELGRVSAGVDRPFPMPVQALDHGVGWLLAAGACRALTQWIETGRPSDVRGSLIGAANVLMSRPTPNGLGLDRPVWSESDRVDGQSQWGPLRRAPLPSQVEGLTPRWTVEAGELGRHRAEWLTGV